MAKIKIDVIADSSQAQAELAKFGDAAEKQFDKASRKSIDLSKALAGVAGKSLMITGNLVALKSSIDMMSESGASAEKKFLGLTAGMATAMGAVKEFGESGRMLGDAWRLAGEGADTFGGKLKNLLQGNMGYGALISASVAAGLAVKEMIDRFAELKEVTAEAADAEAKRGEMTDRTQQQYKRLLEILGMTREEATKHNLTLERLLELSKTSPHGRIAAAVAQLKEETAAVRVEEDKRNKEAMANANAYTAKLKEEIAELERIQALQNEAVKDREAGLKKELQHSKENANALKDLKAKTDAYVQSVRDGTSAWQEQSAAFRAFKAEFTIGGREFGEVTDEDAFNALVKRAKEASKAERPDKWQAYQQKWLGEALKAIQSKDVSLLEDLANALAAQVASLQAAGLADQAMQVMSIAQVVAQYLAELKRITKPEERQLGGPVERGRAYVTGERGPELFVPRESGNIVDAGTTASLLSTLSEIRAALRSGGVGGSMSTVVLNVDGRELARVVNRRNERNEAGRA